MSITIARSLCDVSHSQATMKITPTNQAIAIQYTPFASGSNARRRVKELKSNGVSMGNDHPPERGCRYDPLMHLKVDTTQRDHSQRCFHCKFPPIYHCIVLPYHFVCSSPPFSNNSSSPNNQDQKRRRKLVLGRHLRPAHMPSRVVCLCNLCSFAVRRRKRPRHYQMPLYQWEIRRVKANLKSRLSSTQYLSLRRQCNAV